MRYWQIRLFGLVAALISGALVYYNWQQAIAEGTYSFRLAAIAPFGVVAGIFLIFFPTKSGRPETTLDKFIAMLVVVVGFGAGFYNWYLMDPGRFEELWQVISSAF